MALPFAPRFRRPLVVLLCTQFLLTACGATEPLAVGTVRWPKPALQVTQAEPNFQAPSATHCARPVQTHETPGMGRGPARLEKRALADAASDVSAGAPPPPTGALRRPASPSAAASAKAYGSTASELAALPSVAEAPPAAVALPAPSAPRVSNASPAQAARPASEPVTAGMVDDNADFNEYLNFRGRTQVTHRECDISMRYLLQVRDARGAVVPDAEVAVQAPSGAAM